jgi:hypothetical protein
MWLGYAPFPEPEIKAAIIKVATVHSTETGHGHQVFDRRSGMSGQAPEALSISTNPKTLLNISVPNGKSTG